MSVAPRALALLVLGAVLSACASSGQPIVPSGLESPTTTRNIAPFQPMIERLQRVIAFEHRMMLRVGRPTEQLPNTLANADAIVASVLIGEAGDYVVATRELRAVGSVCRYHGGPTGDRQTIGIDGHGRTWRLALPDLAPTVP